LASSTDSSSCNQADGNAYVNVVANGIPPYTYEWTDGTNILSTDSSLIGVVAGTYYGYAYDSLGCSVIDTVTIYDLSAPQIDSIITTGVLCFGGNTGTAEVYVSGGAFPYTY
ncbi:SprB repeat-containing protein, partial [Vicingus serpentipes]|uniref:SprB repeat-containing protein n=1 Tax=Vicingus serpentipes TaxID=1926625 RepID=UPI001CB915CD